MQAAWAEKAIAHISENRWALCISGVSSTNEKQNSKNPKKILQKHEKKLSS